MLEPQDAVAFREIVGSAGLLLEPAERTGYETPARYGGGRAAAVVRPATTAQVSAVLAHCVRRGIEFTPQSGNTSLVLGAGTDDSGRQIIVSLDRLRQPPQINVHDRTVLVDAGVRLSTLNAVAEPFGLCLPIDLSSDPMIGGMVATNTGGARFLRYGDMRRHVLGLEVVLPDAAGTILRLSSGLRKDNTHLDLRQLFVGSCGALGVITQATLELRTLPRQSAVAVLVPRDEDAVLELLAAFERETGEYLSAFEGMSNAAMRCALANVANLRDPFPDGLPPYAILVELATSAAHKPGTQTLDELLESTVTRLAESNAAPLLDARFGHPEQFWALRHALSEGLRASGTVMGFDLSFKRSHVMAFRRYATEALRAAFPEFEVCDFGHIADGGVHYNVISRVSNVDAARLRALQDLVLQIAIERFAGSFSGEHGVGRANQSAYDQYTAAPIQHYSAIIAAAFAQQPSAAVRFGPQARAQNRSGASTN